MESKQLKRLTAVEEALAPKEARACVIEYDPDGPKPQIPPGCKTVIWLPKKAPLEEFMLPPEGENCDAGDVDRRQARKSKETAGNTSGTLATLAATIAALPPGDRAALAAMLDAPARDMRGFEPELAAV